jgi:hypothetical protein
MSYDRLIMSDEMEGDICPQHLDRLKKTMKNISQIS